MPHFTLVEDLVWEGQEQARMVEKIIKTEKPLKAILSGEGGEAVGKCEQMFYPWHLFPSTISLQKGYQVRIIRELSSEEVGKLFEDAREGLKISYEANLATIYNFFAK